MRGSLAQADGVAAETAVEQVLMAEGWQILARNCRTPAGELDLITTRDGLLVFVEVKRRASLAEAAVAGRTDGRSPVRRFAVTMRQKDGGGGSSSSSRHRQQWWWWRRRLWRWRRRRRTCRLWARLVSRRRPRRRRHRHR